MFSQSLYFIDVEQFTRGITSDQNSLPTVTKTYKWAIADSVAAAITLANITATGGVGTAAVVRAGSTGHQSPDYEKSLTEYAGIPADDLVLGYEDGGDADYNDAFARITVTDWKCYIGLCPPGTNKSGPQAPSTSAANVVYSNGEIQVNTAALQTGGFGSDAITSSIFTNSILQNPSGGASPGSANTGNNRVAGGQMRLNVITAAVAGGGSSTVAQVTVDGVNSNWYVLSGGTYDPQFDVLDTLVKSGTGAAEEYAKTTPTGEVTTFYGTDPAIATALRGKVKSTADAGGRVTTYAYDGSGRISETTRTATSGADTIYESYLHAYVGGAGPNADKVASVTLRRKVNSGGAWSTVRSVAYTYYDGTQAHGNVGDLLKAVVKDAAGATIDTTYYRYHTPEALSGVNVSASMVQGTRTVTATLNAHGLSVGDLVETSGASDARYNGVHTVTAVADANTFSFGANGAPPQSFTGTLSVIRRAYQGGLKYVFERAAYDRMAATVADPLTASETAVAPFASLALEYDGARRVSKAVVGADGCSTCSGGLGTYTYVYEASTNTDDQNAWRTKTTETLPDGNQNVVFANAYGRVMLATFVDRKGTPLTTTDDQIWSDFYRYDADGRVTMHANPSAVTGYDQSKTDLMDSVAGNFQYVAESAGLVETYVYGTSTTATTSSAGDATGYLKSTAIKQGETGTSVPQSAATYIARSGNGTTIFVTATDTRYRNTNGTGGQTTNYGYTWHGTTTRVAQMTMTNPTVTTAQNGSNASTSQMVVYDTDGRPVWTKDAGGFIDYTEYDVATGAVTKTIVDVKTTSVANEPSGWATPTGGGKHLTTTMTVDSVGRTTKEVNPDGEITHTLYADSLHQRLVYRGWNPTTGTATGPTEYTREYRPAANAAVGQRSVYTQTFLTSTTPAVSGSAGSYVPTGTESLSGGLQSLTRQITNDAGQVTETVTYTSLAGTSYSTPTAKFGSVGTNYLLTATDYDSRGRLKRVKEPSGTIRWTVFDGRDRVASTWVGTDDTGAVNGDPDGSGGANNMVKVSENEYDDPADSISGGGVGDGNLTKSLQWFGSGGTDSYATRYQYDFRDRLTAARGPDGVATKYTHDNLSQATTVETFADADADFTIDSTELRGKSVSSFDERGQLYSESRYEVDPASGAASDRLTRLHWYDARGNYIKTREPSGLFNTKNEFDGAGRRVATYVGRDVNELVNEYNEADDLTGDTTIEQDKAFLDPAGRPVVVVNYKRNPTTGTTGGLAQHTSFSQTTVNWFDDAGRVTASVNYGRDNGVTNGVSGGTRYVFDASGVLIDSDADGIPNVAEAAAPAPNSSDDYLVTKYEYDSAGRLYRQTDNKGHVTQFSYDLAGRTTQQVENYVNGAVAETETDTDRTTQWVYGTDGTLTKLVAKNPKGSGSGVESQETEYLYESSFDGSWVTNTIYPDSGDTTSAGTDQVKATYDRLGRQVTSTDQRGVVHTFAYDAAGRFASDAVTTLPGGVDGGVRRVGRAYDDLSRVQKVTSYDAASAGSVVNEVKYTYDGWGNVVKSEQNAAGAVGAGTPAVQYAFADGASAGEAQYVRQQYLTYADGRQLEYVYPVGGGFDGHTLSRWYAIKDVTAGNVTVASYSWLGSSQLAYRSERTAVSGGLTLDYGDDLSGWDRFGRVIDQKWTNTAGTTDVDRTKYTYDRNSNRLTRDVQSTGGTTGHDEAYTYDGLDRLSGFDRGTLTSGTLGTVNFSQDWNSLDSLGNWKQFTEDTNGTTSGGSTAYNRTHNAANELTDSGSTWIDPTYDAAGNMTAAPVAGSETTAQYYVYDGWNHLVGVSLNAEGDFTDTGEYRYEYDGLGRRVEKDKAGGTADDLVYLYSEQYQILEVRKGGDADPLEQYVYGAEYVDAPVVRYYDSNVDGDYVDAGDNTLYPTFDANYNITAVVNGSGTVVERYEYATYGKRTVLDANFSLDTDGETDVAVWLGHQGLLQDAETKLVYNRARFYHVTLGRFTQPDPIGYVNGHSLYEYVGNNPINRNDPSGLAWGDYPALYKHEEWTSFFWPTPAAIKALISKIESEEFGCYIDPGKGDYRHCVGGCILSRRVGLAFGYLALVIQDWDETDPMDEAAGEKGFAMGADPAGFSKSCRELCKAAIVRPLGPKKPNCPSPDPECDK